MRFWFLVLLIVAGVVAVGATVYLLDLSLWVLPVGWGGVLVAAAVYDQKVMR